MNIFEIEDSLKQGLLKYKDLDDVETTSSLSDFIHDTISNMRINTKIEEVTHD